MSERDGAAPAPGASRVRALLGGPALAPLFEAVFQRLEDTGGAARTVSLRGAREETRRAVADLLGWEVVPRDPVRIDLAELDAALRESAAAVDLRGAVELLCGPVGDARAERRAQRSARERRWADAHAAVAAAGRSELGPWLDQLERGAIARAARAAGRPEDALLADALRVALRLPAGGRLLAVFAGEVLGDPHALDAGAPLTPLALRAAAAIAGHAEVPPGAPARRRLWAEVGIDCDPLSASALVHGLRPGGPGLLARHLREAAEAGEPRRVTLRELARADLAFAAGEPLFVCENPAVVAAAADALGARSAPLVCAEGVPSTAVLEILRRAATCGARLRIRADLDWPGLRIAAQLLAVGSAEPWRLTARDYHEAIAEGRTGPRLEGRCVPSAWDRALAAAMVTAGLSVPEERLVEALVGDLERR